MNTASATSQSNPLRFTVRWLLAVTSIVCVAMAIASRWLPYGAQSQAVRQLERMRNDYPLVPLRDRLTATQVSAPTGGLPLSEDSEQQLIEQESQYEKLSQGFGRRWALERLHDDSYRNFITSPGFGFSRGFRVSPRSLMVDEIDKRTFPLQLESSPGDSSPASTEPSSVHQHVTVNFLNPNSMGYVKSADQVAGFEPHAIRRSNLYWLQTNDKPRTAWQVDRLELVSLLMHEKPVVYQSNQLPRMDRVGEYQTRELDGFEARALQSLYQHADLEIDDSGNTIRMLGSLRAATQCLSCHQVERGTLLGAFSYQLKKHSPGTQPSSDTPKPALQK